MEDKVTPGPENCQESGTIEWITSILTTHYFSLGEDNQMSGVKPGSQAT